MIAETLPLFPELEQGPELEQSIYRHELLPLRIWDASKPRIGFVMLNPSTADEKRNDPTIKKCIGFAKVYGFGGIEVANLFAYRATDPIAMKRQGRTGFDVIGPENDQAILKVADSVDLLVVAWGNHGGFQGRDRAVLTLLKDYRLHRIGPLAKTGQPQHPLMLAYKLPLIPLED